MKHNGLHAHHKLTMLLALWTCQLLGKDVRMLISTIILHMTGEMPCSLRTRINTGKQAWAGNQLFG
jgi:hypothetical protein